MFKSIDLNPRILESACKKSKVNWEWWRDDFTHCGSFSEMPVFLDYPRFRGFGADYSVFRGLRAEECETIRVWFRAQANPTSFSELFESFMRFSRNKQDFKGRAQNRVSLVSKLLTMWKPRDFAMWDTLAKKGLKSIHGSRRGHCYTSNTASTYKIFNGDFFALLAEKEPELRTICGGFEHFVEDSNFVPRILDNYLLLVGSGAERNGPES